MITHDAVRHNAAAAGSTLLRRGVLIVPSLVVLILALTACSRDAGTEGKPSAQAANPGTDCALTTDAGAWTAFKEVADRAAAGEDMTREELDAFGDLPTVTLWRNSLQPDVPPAHRIGNWLEGTFWKELGREGNQKMNATRATLMRSYRYSLDHRDRIDERLAELTGPRKCEVAEMARFWIEPDLLPQPLAIHFLPAKAEIRIFEGSLLVDTGVVSAGSVDQVIHQMASLLYRKFQFVSGPSPIEQEGAEAVAHSFRVLMNEGLAGWIEQTLALEFDSRHPVLYKINIIPEDFFIKTRETIGLMNLHLGPMLDDETEMAAKGLDFARHLAGMFAFSQTGCGMSTVIAAHLGEDRLRDAGRSVPAFLAAYQEAASLNPVPIPVPGELDSELYQTVPPLDPEIFTKLHAMLTRVFPE
jgi:hypothetical protein